MAAQPRSELQELVDAPNETLAVEYKSWLDLNENASRADLARHIAALANHGGGHISFGFDDQMQYSGPTTYTGFTIDRDLISASCANIWSRHFNVTFT